MHITDADRQGAQRIARVQVKRHNQMSGSYPVGVGGFWVGRVEKMEGPQGETYWVAKDRDEKSVGQTYGRRMDAVAFLAGTDDAAENYRESARLGYQGTAERKRVRDEDEVRYQDLLAEQEAEDAAKAAEVVAEAEQAVAVAEVRRERDELDARATEENIAAVDKLGLSHASWSKDGRTYLVVFAPTHKDQVALQEAVRPLGLYPHLTEWPSNYTLRSISIINQEGTVALSPLNMITALSLADIITAAQQGLRVGWVDPQTCAERWGIARSIGNESGGFARNDQDVRTAYLRVTLREGLDTYLPVQQVIEQHQEGSFLTGVTFPK